MSDKPDRALLESKERDELLQIAAALDVEIAPRARKNTIIDAIVGPAPTGAFADGGTHAASGDGASGGAVSGRAASGGAASDEPVSGGAALGDESAGDGDADVEGDSADSQDSSESSGAKGADSEADDDVPVAEDGNRRSRRRGRGQDDSEITGESVHCDGLLDLRDEGYGFLRTHGPLPSADDVYVAARQVRQYDLRRGDRITGHSRPAARSERNPALLRLDTLNGEPPAEPPSGQPSRPLFSELVAVLPSEPLRLGSGPGNAALSVIDETAPVGLGSRGLLTARAGTGRSATPLFGAIATAIGEQHPDTHLIVLLVAERPEDITEMSRRLETSGEVLASTFDRPPEEHIAVAELTLERTKRMAEAGNDVVILFNGATRLARAYAATANGRNQPADGVGAAVSSVLRFFGGARNLEDAGSVTMLAAVEPVADAEGGPGAGSGLDDRVLARLREAATLELALGAPLPTREDISAGRLEPDHGVCFSLGDHQGN